MNDAISPAMPARKQSICRRFHMVTPIALEGYCEILESMAIRNVHRIDGNNAKFQLSPSQADTLAKFYVLNDWACVFVEKPARGEYALREFTPQELIDELKS